MLNRHSPQIIKKLYFFKEEISSEQQFQVEVERVFHLLDVKRRSQFRVVNDEGCFFSSDYKKYQ